MPSRLLSPLAFCSILALVGACADPECPYGYMKIQNACIRIDAGADRGLESEEAGASAATMDEAGPAPGSSDAAQPPSGSSFDAATIPAPSAPTADGGSGMQPPQPESDAGTAPADAETPPPVLPECDSARPCAAGFVCTAMKCVSACTQTQCDPNATCSLVNNTPTCTCNRGYIAMTGAGGAVTCVRDVACEELGCDTNASCVVGADQLRTCVCKNGYTGTGKTCTPVSCEAPTIENGTVSTSSGNTFGSTATYRCNTGYQQASGGSWTRMCGANMQWSGTQPRCTAITCTPAPTNPQNGTVSLSQGSQYGSVATYACNQGYALQGSATRTCGATGWSGSAPRCEATCGNGRLDPGEGEACDRSVPGTSVWTCSTSCTRTTMYTACSASQPCASGQTCAYGFCTHSCSGFSECISTPTGPTNQYCATAGTGMCMAYGCSTSRDCAPGLNCVISANGADRFCAVCSHFAGTTCR